MRTASTDGLTWDDGVNNGGVEILDYRVNQKAEGETEFTVVATGVLTKSYTV